MVVEVWDHARVGDAGDDNGQSGIHRHKKPRIVEFNEGEGQGT